MLHARIDRLAKNALFMSKNASFDITPNVGFYRTKLKNKNKILRCNLKFLFHHYWILDTKGFLKFHGASPI